MKFKGTFEVTMQAEPPFDVVHGVSLSRASFDKRFGGSLEATSKVQMLAARTPVKDSAGYVALERITGTLEGRTGSFVLVHVGLMNHGERSLKIHIVADSGTEGFSGIQGTMNIDIVDGKHFYELDCEFPS
jgi:hypothetical protein